MRTDRRGGLAAAGVLLLVGGMAVGAGASRVLFVACGLLGCAVVFWAWRRAAVSAGLVLAVAIVARLAVLPLGPSVSDDGYRYVWDGQMSVQGINPYAHRPLDVPPDAGDPQLLAVLNSPAYFSVYPPAAQLVFAAGAASGGGEFRVAWLVIKLLLTLLEVAGLFALARLVSPAALLLYAWHPLAIIETAGQGHLEGGMVGMLLLAAWAVARRRAALAGAALAVAGMLKLWPLLLVPFAMRDRPARLAAAAAGTVALLAIPFAAPYVLPNVRESLALYTTFFEWYAAPYFVTREALSAVQPGWRGAAGTLLQVLFLASLPVLWVIARRRRWPARRAWLVVAALFIATATTVHPWYLLGVLALIALVHGRQPGAAGMLHVAAWHALAAGALATYLFYTHGDAPYLAAVIVGWSAWTVLLAASGALALLPRVMRARAAAKWAWAAPHIPAGERVLDLGAGEGFVGEAASRAGHDVVLADVVDFNATDLPLTITNGRDLPFASGAFDATLLIFVLHHARDPLALLREAARVAHGPVVVIESLAETRWDRWWLPRADRLANRLRSGGAMAAQEEHLDFRSAPGWREAFTRAGLRVVHEEGRGGLLHRQRLFVLVRDATDAPPARERRSAPLRDAST